MEKQIKDVKKSAAEMCAAMLGLSGTARRDFFVIYGEPVATFDPKNNNQDAFRLQVGLQMEMSICDLFVFVSHWKIPTGVSWKIEETEVEPGVFNRSRADQEKAARMAILAMGVQLYMKEHANV